MTDGEKRYALALGRHLRAVRESHGFTQGQAAQLYRQKTGKHGAGLVDLECGRSTVLTLLKLRCLKEIYGASYDELLQFDDPGVDGADARKSFSRRLARCMAEAHGGRPYSLFFQGSRYVRRISEREDVVEISVISPDSGRWSRTLWPRETVERFSVEDFERQFARLLFRLKKASEEKPMREILLIRAEKRDGKIFCRSVDDFPGKSGEEIAVSGCEQLLQYLEGYQRLGYEIELTGFIE